MNWWMVPVAAGCCFLVAFLVGLFAAMVAGSRADDEMEAYWREREEDPPAGI